MKRKIIRIDEDLCTGCGNCVTGCAEGALQIVDGKAKLVKEQFCDGFGDCIGTCPTGALTIEERDSAEFDIEATAAYLQETQGEDAVKRMRDANTRHDAPTPAPAAPPPAPRGGCPGSRMRASIKEDPSSAPASGGTLPAKINTSELNQWPIQLHLVSPGAPFFQDKELVVLSTCAPIASADCHWRFIRGRSVVVACPKLDRTEGYAEKLGGILQDESIPKIIIVRMEVPCCGGLTMIVKQAVELSGRTNLVVQEVVVGLNGEVLSD